MTGMAERMMARNAAAQGIDAADLFALEQPTPEQLRERAKVAQRVKKEETREIPRPEDFQLCGSTRAADDPQQRSLI